jgi:hypothetical protein
VSVDERFARLFQSRHGPRTTPRDSRPAFSRYNALVFPYTNILLRPLPHGAVGFWDEVLNLIPLLFGSGLLFYLYFGARKRRATEAQQRAATPDPAAPPEEHPKT